MRNTKRKCIKSPCSFQKPSIFTVYDLKRKKSNKYQYIKIYEVFSYYNGMRLYRAGDGIAWALCTSMINFISLQTLSFRQADSTTAAAPEPCAHTLFNDKVRYINFIIILFLYHCARFDPVLSRKKKTNTKSCSFSFGAGDGIRTRDFHLGKVAFYH